MATQSKLTIEQSTQDGGTIIMINGTPIEELGLYITDLTINMTSTEIPEVTMTLLFPQGIDFNGEVDLTFEEPHGLPRD